jgi:hypothetical protein
MYSMQPEQGMKPDRWVLVKAERPDGGVSYGILSGNYGGYTGGNDWRLSSRVVKAEETDFGYVVETVSGSTYRLGLGALGFTSDTSRLAQQWSADNAKPDATKFTAFDTEETVAKEITEAFNI